MKIRVRQNNTDIDSIRVGDCFWHSGYLYMKIASDGMIFDDSGKELTPAVILSTGNSRWIEPSTQVERADCAVVDVSEIKPTSTDDRWTI